jgi:hypothetical protein
MSSGDPLSDWVVASNCFYVLIVVYLAWVGKLARYACESTMLMLAMVSSMYYHLCWTSERNWCIGPASRSAPDIFLLRDVLFSYLSLVQLSCLVCNELWWVYLPRDDPGRAHTAAVMLGSVSTLLLVIHFGDDTPTSVSIPLACGLCVATAIGYFLYQLRALQKPTPRWRFWACLVCGCALMLTGFLSRVVSNATAFNPDTPGMQSKAYQRSHSVWHMFSAVGALLLIATSSFKGDSLYEPLPARRIAAAAKH